MWVAYLLMLLGTGQFDLQFLRAPFPAKKEGEKKGHGFRWGDLSGRFLEYKVPGKN